MRSSERSNDFDGVKVGGVGGQEEEPGAALCEAGAGFRAFVGSEVVENDHVTGLEGGCELSADIGVEGCPVHRAIQNPGGDQSVTAQPGDEGLCAPMAKRRGGVQAGAAGAAPAPPRHLGIRRSFVNEHKAFWYPAHPGLAQMTPDMALMPKTCAFALLGQQRFFYM